MRIMFSITAFSLCLFIALNRFALGNYGWGCMWAVVALIHASILFSYIREAKIGKAKEDK